ncbi:MAG: oxidoreductase, partial [Rhodobacteraceae bacterium]|nr:oxidoreductase [Paracoccaceae bacterium]
AAVEAVEDSMLPEGDVTIDIAYSSLNYKDGLCIGSGGGLVKTYPHVPGIDLAGTVADSADSRFAPGEMVLSTGWRVGEIRWGGFAQRARLKAGWLVKIPNGLDARKTMILGTAGLTAMLGVDALERHGLTPGNGPVLVTGAAGGVGSIATVLLARLGYEVAAVTGRPAAGPYLRSLGATSIIDRADIAETVKRPLESETWAGCIDAVGGSMLARVLGQMRYGSSVAAIGLAGGANLPTSVIPFLLRRVSLLGIDSVSTPIPDREHAWQRMATIIPDDALESVLSVRTLDDLPELGPQILKGQVKGRVIIDVNA